MENFKRDIRAYMRPILTDVVDVAVGMVVFFVLLTLGEKAIEGCTYIRAYIAALWKVYVKKPKRDISLGDSIVDIRADKEKWNPYKDPPDGWQAPVWDPEIHETM